jgi:HEXXH motif-containing protein
MSRALVWAAVRTAGFAVSGYNPGKRLEASLSPIGPGAERGKPTQQDGPALSADQFFSQLDIRSLGSGAVDPKLVARLRRIEQTFRRALLDEVFSALLERTVGGAHAQVAHAVRTIKEGDRHSPDTAAQILGYPFVGHWATVQLRRTADESLAFDLGYLYALAASVAVVTRQVFAEEVPVKKGFLALPGLGAIRIRDDGWSGTLPIRIRDGQVLVEDDSGQLAVAGRPTALNLQWERDNRRATIAVDVTDPYRTFASSPADPEHISATEMGLWSGAFSAAMDALFRIVPHHADIISQTLTTVVPLPAAPAQQALSASSGTAFGAAVVSFPDDPIQFAATLIHEVQHMKLGVVLNTAPLVDPLGQERFYAPWRDDPRPLSGLLQGIFAFHQVCDFWWRQCSERSAAADGALFEFGLWRLNVMSACRQALAAKGLTPTGRMVVTGLLESCSALPGPVGRAERLATMAATEHRARWRVGNVTPDSDYVTALMAAWEVGVPPPATSHEPVFRDQPDGLPNGDDMAVLIRRQLLTPAPGYFSMPGSTGGASAADLAMATGQFTSAVAGYSSIVAKPAQGPHAWIRYALARWMSGDSGRKSRTLDEPELFAALVTCLAAAGHEPSMSALVRWFDADD